MLSPEGKVASRGNTRDQQSLSTSLEASWSGGCRGEKVLPYGKVAADFSLRVVCSFNLEIGYSFLSRLRLAVYGLRFPQLYIAAHAMHTIKDK